MAVSLRPRAVPQCSACLRNYVFAALAQETASATGLRQQIRGKKKMPNNSSTVTVRLLRDVKTYGRKGAIVPVSRGDMRNAWFPRRIAEYVTVPEMKTLRLNNIAMQRDHGFGITATAKEANAESAWQKDIPSDVKSMSNEELRSASAFGSEPKVDIEKLTPERSMELVEIFAPARLDFWRQPIIEEKPKEPEQPAPEPEKPLQFGGAAGDLLAARRREPEKQKEEVPSQAIYGSVSTNDVLVALRAALGVNDEAGRVVLHENDISFVDLPDLEGSEASRVKHTGEFMVEIKIRGSGRAIRRPVRVIPQDA